MARTPLLLCEVSVRIRPKLAIQDLAFTRRVFETACAKTQHSTYQQALLLANFIAMSIGLEIRMKPPYQNAIWFGTAGLRLLLRAAHPSCGKRDRVKVGRACANLAFSKAKRDRLSIPPSGFSPIWPRKSLRLVVLRRRGNIPHRQSFSNTDDRFPQRIKGRASIDSFKNGVLLCSTVRIPRAL
jgi:hypothetical protein